MESDCGNKMSGQRHIVIVPYPGRGHINPMINLCRLLASRDKLLISFIVTEEWSELVSSSSAPLPHSLQLCTIPNVIPSERTHGTDHSGFVLAVYTKMAAPVEELIQRLHPPVGSIITSSCLMWVAEIGKRRNIPVSSLWTDSPSLFLAFHKFNVVDTDDQQDDISGGNNGALAYLPRVSSSQFGDILNNISSRTLIQKYKQAFSWFAGSQALLFTSFYELDSGAIDTLRSTFSIPIYPLGPSIPYMTLNTETKDSYIRWLDTQPLCSVLYVALGSFASVSSDQMTELAVGLQKSGVRFLFVVREDGEKMQELCEGGMGVIIPWCDQLKVLCHPSVGGFLTHCGWNSVLEGVYAGVPMLAFPLIWDQYPNSKLIVDKWRIGLRLKDENVGDHEVVASEEIARMVKQLMEGESVESKEVRRKAKELKEMCRMAIDEGGSLSRNLDGFVQSILDV